MVDEIENEHKIQYLQRNLTRHVGCDQCLSTTMVYKTIPVSSTALMGTQVCRLSIKSRSAESSDVSNPQPYSTQH